MNDRELEQRLAAAFRATPLPVAPSRLSEALERAVEASIDPAASRSAATITVLRTLAVAAVLVVSGAVAVTVGGRDVMPAPSVERDEPSSSPSPSLTYRLDCGPMVRSDCETRAASMVEGAVQRFPGKTIDRVEFTSEDGDGAVIFDDGTSIVISVN